MLLVYVLYTVSALMFKLSDFGAKCIRKGLALNSQSLQVLDSPQIYIPRMDSN